MRHRQFLQCQCLKQSRESSSLQPTAKDSGSDNNGNRYLPQRASHPLGKVFCSLLFRHRCSDTVVAIISLYSLAVFNLKLLVCICFQVVLFFTLCLWPLRAATVGSMPTESVQRPLRMVVFLTQSVVDVFGVLRN